MARDVDWKGDGSRKYRIPPIGRIGVWALAVVCAVSLSGNFLVYERFSTTHPIMDVGDQVIRRRDLDLRMNYLYSTSVLRSMIVESVVDQAAAKRGLLPSDAAVQSEIADMKRTDPDTVQQAMQLDPSLQLFPNTVKTQMALRALQLDGVSVTADDVQRYYARHRQEFRTPPKITSDIAVAHDADAAESAALLFETDATPADLTGQYGVTLLGVNSSPDDFLPESALQAIDAMKPGSVRILHTAPQQFFVAHVLKNEPGQTPPLKAIRPQVELAARLAKAPTPRQVMARLTDSADIKAETSRYAGAVPDYGAATPAAR